MGDGADDEAEAFDGAGGLARETDDEGALDDGGKVARKDGVFSNFHRLDAHDFAETGKFPHGDLTDCFWSDVAECDSGAAGGEN